jgi:hypothetical protein
VRSRIRPSASQVRAPNRDSAHPSELQPGRLQGGLTDTIGCAFVATSGRNGAGDEAPAE